MSAEVSCGYVRGLALRARESADIMATAGSEQRRALVEAMADAVEADLAGILVANADDLLRARAAGLQGAMLDRLSLDQRRVAGIVAALREIAALPDPVGQVTRSSTRPNGLRIERMRVPLGVIAMIYEARPNVTADAAALSQGRQRGNPARRLRGAGEQSRHRRRTQRRSRPSSGEPAVRR